MFSKIDSVCLSGMEGRSVAVEADVSDGLPGYILVGYLASEVREGGDRVRAAIRNLGISLPPKKVTINLSPADFRKEGTGFDLAIAVAVLVAYGQLPADMTTDSVFVGELGLDGELKGIPGILAIASWAAAHGCSRIFLPEENVREASVIGNIQLIPGKNLRQLLPMLRGETPLEIYERPAGFPDAEKRNVYEVDFSEVNGQKLLRRAAEVAAAGGHNLLMVGSAGAGKTMIARRIPTIMPRLTAEECIEISKIYSVSHLLSDQEPLILRRPFRNPHHSVSVQALTGGGARPKPGEISLAAGGILFLDEMPEMSRAALESLRQPLEERTVTVTRVQGTACYPADFQLVAAMNYCPCGRYPDLSRCTCTQGQIRKYLQKVSGPLLERIDLCVEASPVTFGEISRRDKNESSEAVRIRVEAARSIQRERFRNMEIHCNGEMRGTHIRKFCSLAEGEERFMEEIFDALKLSARVYDRILKMARTIADLDKKEKIGHGHLCEAISYVRVKKKLWEN